jgi:mRNA interferase MazF
MPRRGEVWMVDLGMAQKSRPGLILSSGYSGADRALVTVVSHTTSVRGSAFEISVPQARSIHSAEHHYHP